MLKLEFYCKLGFPISRLHQHLILFMVCFVRLFYFYSICFSIFIFFGVFHFEWYQQKVIIWEWS